jgi:hypothetical protein
MIKYYIENKLKNITKFQKEAKKNYDQKDITGTNSKQLKENKTNKVPITRSRTREKEKGHAQTS